MEPFISRDGRYLFFNNMGADKDIFYATYNTLNDVFVFADTISAINTPAVEGVPTLDENNRFYYISTFNYPPHNVNIFDTTYVGDFDPASPAVVNNLAVVPFARPRSCLLTVVLSRRPPCRPMSGSSITTGAIQRPTCL